MKRTEHWHVRTVARDEDRVAFLRGLKGWDYIELAVEGDLGIITFDIEAGYLPRLFFGRGDLTEGYSPIEIRNNEPDYSRAELSNEEFLACAKKKLEEFRRQQPC